MGKGEIARYEQFLLSHSVFKRLVSQGCQKVSLCGNGLNRIWQNTGFNRRPLGLEDSLTGYLSGYTALCSSFQYPKTWNPPNPKPPPTCPFRPEENKEIVTCKILPLWWPGQTSYSWYKTVALYLTEVFNYFPLYHTIQHFLSHW